MKIAIHLEEGKPDKTRIHLDGVDVTRSVLVTGFKIDAGLEADPVVPQPTVTLTFAPDVLELDIDGDLRASLNEDA